MLLSLKVRNYALINELYVEFHNGLNIITGETGAGKSILLGALGLILGKRADLNVLLNSESKCVVEAEFNISDYNLKAVFEENDVDYENHTVFRREILVSGKSRAFINDTPVNLSVMQELALKLVDIHSQHQNLQLNKQAFLLNMIDNYCGNKKLLLEYSGLYNNYRLKEKQYKDQLEKHNNIKEQFEFISHQYNELKDAELVGGEYLNLEEELERIENSGDIKQALHVVESLLAEDENGIVDKLRFAAQRLEKIMKVYPDAETYKNRIDSVSIELKDTVSDISKSFEKLDFDPERYEVVKERLSVINGLLLKFRKDTVEELIDLREELKNKVSVAVDGGIELEEQKKALDELLKKVTEKAEQLSERRKKSFKSFEQEILKVLVEVGMGHAEISFTHSELDLSLSGIDNINLYFSANKNHPLNEVAKIASGGELSRLMLAIKSIISKSTALPTLLLDEIDTGVSGDIADKVGTIIKGISRGLQVINITHLPQVASKGEAHFLVYKEHNHETTRTLMKKLSEDERVQEIAKMLSGEKLTDVAIENARILLGK